MRARTISLALIVIAGCGTGLPLGLEHGADGAFRFEISYPPELTSGPLDGRVLLFIASPSSTTGAGAEPPASPLVEPDMFSVEPDEAEPRFRSSPPRVARTRASTRSSISVSFACAATPSRSRSSRSAMPRSARSPSSTRGSRSRPTAGGASWR